jgi:hypothetical protein
MGYEHGDEPPCNLSANHNFYEVMEARVARRGFLMALVHDQRPTTAPPFVHTFAQPTRIVTGLAVAI